MRLRSGQPEEAPSAGREAGAWGWLALGLLPALALLILAATLLAVGARFRWANEPGIRAGTQVSVFLEGMASARSLGFNAVLETPFSAPMPLVLLEIYGMPLALLWMPSCSWVALVRFGFPRRH